jgi:oligopeptidase A
MQYADDRKLRETLYHASARAPPSSASRMGQRAAHRKDRAAAPRDGAASRLPRLRRSLLVPKMAESPSQVLAFLAGPRQARPAFAEQDVAELREFAEEELGLDKLESWDVAYASEKLRAKRYSFSDQEVKQYFPEERGHRRPVHRRRAPVRREDRPAKAPLWHQDVRFYEVRDAKGTPIGQFYMDLYARETKRGGAWMDDAITRRRKRGQLQIPVAYLNCNFSRPVGGKPALFTHDEVLTLFHEFGHGLHHLLTRIEDLGVSGINGVEWDAVELPSQFMENFCWEWDVLQGMTRHVDTGKPLPRALFDKMLAAKNFQSGLAMLRQIEFAVFDMRLHSDFDPRPAAARCSCSRKCASRSRCSSRRPTTASRTASRTFLPAATPRATTATSGPKCSPRMPTASSRRRSAEPDGGRAFPRRDPRGRRQPPGGGLVQGVPRREPNVEALLRHSGMAV